MVEEGVEQGGRGVREAVELSIKRVEAWLVKLTK